MHLLKRSPDGTLHLHEFIDGNIPAYAIPSHRWGADEPTFQDIAEPSSRESTKAAGLDKLHFCGRQAARDGLSYFWVDTVCIDKKSSAHLTEALNSMYRWYAESAKCYVYMSDVEKLDPDFYHSTWFQRGWTLQELLAPKIVEFFSASQQLLATKRFLEPQIVDITGIPTKALRGRIHDFTSEEKLLWGRNRVTTRVEDRAYCLMGIFDIFMPVIYGEGERAFDRLFDEIKRRKQARKPPLPTTITRSSTCNAEPKSHDRTVRGATDLTSQDRMNFVSGAYDNRQERPSTKRAEARRPPDPTTTRPQRPTRYGASQGTYRSAPRVQKYVDSDSDSDWPADDLSDPRLYGEAPGVSSRNLQKRPGLRSGLDAGPEAGLRSRHVPTVQVQPDSGRPFHFLGDDTGGGFQFSNAEDIFAEFMMSSKKPDVSAGESSRGNSRS